MTLMSMTGGSKLLTAAVLVLNNAGLDWPLSFRDALIVHETLVSGAKLNYSLRGTALF